MKQHLSQFLGVSTLKKFLELRSILFYILFSITFFFLGMVFAGIIGAAEGQGLAGGAIVFGYGVASGFVALVVSILGVQFLSRELVVTSNKILVILLVLVVGFIVYRYKTRNDSLNQSRGDEPGKVLRATIIPTDQMGGSEFPPDMGVGMAKPKFFENSVIYFYGNLTLGKTVTDHAPSDSLVFARTERGMELTYAPPWFVPAHLKLDYDILFLRVITVHQEFIEVVVNELDGRTSYMDRGHNEVRCWPEFLLSMNSIEPEDPSTNPVRVKPLDHASTVMGDFAFLRPVGISSQWVQVELLDHDLRSGGRGWVRWRDNGKLLTTYSLLS